MLKHCWRMLDDNFKQIKVKPDPTFSNIAPHSVQSRLNTCCSGVAGSIIGGGGGHIHIFVFTDLKNNLFQKKIIMQNTNV